MKKYKPIDIDTSVAHEVAIAYTATNNSPMSIIHSARSGLLLSHVASIGALMGITLTELATILHISLRTLQRYPVDKLLDTDASGKGIRLSQLYRHGLDIFEDHEDLASWLHTDLAILGDASPLSMLDTTFGFDLVDELLGRIEYGIFA